MVSETSSLEMKLRKVTPGKVPSETWFVDFSTMKRMKAESLELNCQYIWSFFDCKLLSRLHILRAPIKVRNCARLSYLGHLYLLAASRTSGRVNFWRAFSTESHPFARFKREFMPTCLYFQAQVQKRVKSIGFVVA
jgi:hypothetical protein